jgi:hypothetical protein
MHINELSIGQIQQEICLFSGQRNLAEALGMKKHAKLHGAYLKALWARLNEIDPRPEIDDEQLLAELGIVI